MTDAERVTANMKAKGLVPKPKPKPKAKPKKEKVDAQTQD